MPFPVYWPKCSTSAPSRVDSQAVSPRAPSDVALIVTLPAKAGEADRSACNCE